MASLGTVSWGSSPVINIALSYDYYRSGANMVYAVSVSVQPVTGAKYFGYPIYVSVTMDGASHGSGTIKSASPSQWSSALNWDTGWQTIYNKTSGSTSVGIRIYSGSGSSRDTTYWYSMTVSPAGSTITAANGTLGTQQTITINKQNPSFTDTVTWTCGGQSGTIAASPSETSRNWTPAISLASEATDSTSVPITITTATYDGATYIQSNSTTITCAIPASVKPSASVAISDGNGYASTYGAYVQTKSTITYTVTPTTSYNSPINTYSVSADGNTYTAATYTTPVLQATGAQTVSATVTDKRGRTSDAATASYTVLAYAQPYLSSCVVQRCDSGGTADPEGHYMSVDFTGVITALNNNNSATWAIRYKVAGSGIWTDVALSSLNGNYTPTHQEIIAAADANAFEVEVRATDDFGTITVGTGQIPVAFTIINWRTNGDGMAIGGINTQAGLQVYMDTDISGDLSVSGDTTFIGDIVGDVNFTDDIYNYGVNVSDIALECKNYAYIFPTIRSGSSNGLTWTVDHSDNSITINGTATADTWISYTGSMSGDGAGADVTALQGKEMTLSIIPANCGVEAFAAFFTGAGDTYVDVQLGIVDSYTFTVPNNALRNRSGMCVPNGTTVSNVKIKLLFQETTVTDTNYVPHAMSNLELTNSLFVKRFTKAYSVAGNNSLSFDASFITIPSGYVILGFMGVSTNNDRVVPRSWRYNGDLSYQYSFEIQNLNSSTINKDFAVYVLFARADLVTFDIYA